MSDDAERLGETASGRLLRMRGQLDQVEAEIGRSWLGRVALVLTLFWTRLRR